MSSLHERSDFRPRGQSSKGKCRREVKLLYAFRISQCCVLVNPGRPDDIILPKNSLRVVMTVPMASLFFCVIGFMPK